MSLKMKNISFMVGMIVLFLTLWGVSLLAEGATGFTGLGEKVAISPDDETVAFSYYEDGDAALYTVPANGGQAERLAEPEEGKSYIHPVYSSDGDKIAFIEQWESEEQPLSELKMIDGASGHIDNLTNEGDHITDAVFSSDGDELYFLKSGVFENYSPIASEHPHGFDIYRLDIDSKEVEQITKKDAYSMSSLSLTPDDEQLVYHTFQNDDVIASYSLDKRIEQTFIPKGEDLKESIVSSPTLSPDGKHIAFSGVADYEDNGNFIYEGFQVDLETKEAKQITSFREHVASLNYFNDDQCLLVIIDKNFASREADYQYWIVNLDTDNQKRFQIQLPNEKEK